MHHCVICKPINFACRTSLLCYDVLKAFGVIYSVFISEGAMYFNFLFSLLLWLALVLLGSSSPHCHKIKFTRDTREETFHAPKKTGFVCKTIVLFKRPQTHRKVWQCALVKISQFSDIFRVHTVWYLQIFVRFNI